MHQDACSTTNGGEGFPWWATADFQQRAGCKLEQCCCCWLVVWNMNFMTFHSVGNFILPTDFHSYFFQRGRYTTNQVAVASHAGAVSVGQIPVVLHTSPRQCIHSSPSFACATVWPGSSVLTSRHMIRTPFPGNLTPLVPKVILHG